MAIRQTGGMLIRQLADKIAEIAEPAFQQSVNEALIGAAQRELTKEFAAGEDPYGEGWVALKHGNGTPFGKSKRFLRRLVFVPLSGGGFRLDAVGPIVHQTGAHIEAHTVGGRANLYSKSGRRVSAHAAFRLKFVESRYQQAHTVVAFDLPKRQVLPQDETGGAGEWADPLKRAAASALREHLKKDG